MSPAYILCRIPTDWDACLTRARFGSGSSQAKQQKNKETLQYRSPPHLRKRQSNHTQT